MFAETNTFGDLAQKAPKPCGTSRVLGGTMQASWGMENEAPTPCRTGELYGEKGTWYVPNTCSIQDVYTRADPGVRGADDPATKFKVKEYVHEGEVQKHTAKFASEQDLQPIGLHAGFFAHPDKMTMVRASNAGCPSSPAQNIELTSGAAFVRFLARLLVCSLVVPHRLITTWGRFGRPPRGTITHHSCPW